MTGVELATAYVSLVVEGSKIAPEVKRQFGKVGVEADRAGKESGKKFGSSFSGAAKGLFAGAGVAAIGAKLIGATKDAAALDTKMREVVTLFGETGKAGEKTLGSIRSGVKDVSNEFGVAQETLTSGLYQAISAGVPRENAFEFLKVATKASIGGVTDVETAVDGITTTINAFGLKASDASKVADSMFTTVKGGKTTLKLLSDSLFNVAPAAAAAGVSFKEVNAAIATLTAGGTPTSVATTQLRAALDGLQKPSAALDKIFGSLGFKNAQVAIKAKGLGFALDAVKKASNGNNGALQTLLGSSEAVAAANVIAGTGAKKFASELKNQAHSAGAANAAFKQVDQSAERQFAKVQTNVRNIGISIGQQLLPALVEGSAKLNEFVKGMQDGTGAGGKVADVLKDIAGVGKDVANFFDHLPGGVKKFGAEGAIALLVFSKFSGVMGSATAGLGRYVVGAEAATARTAALKAGMRNLAGAGGMLLLYQSTKQANAGLSSLEAVAGGALLGFAVGGPIGGAIGAGAGGLYSLAHAMKETASETHTADGRLASYVDTLHAGATAINKMTRATVIKNATDSGAIAQGRKLGFSSAEVVDAILGDPKQVARAHKLMIDADKALVAGMKVTYDEYGNIKDITDSTSQATVDASVAVSTFTSNIGLNATALKNDVIRVNEAALAAKKYGKVLPGIPKKVATRVDVLGLEKSAHNIVGLTARYHLVPSQVRTILEAAGEKPTVTRIQHIINKAKELDGTVATVTLRAKGATGLPGIAGAVGPTKRANGGPVHAGTPYIVGERRPELFVPNQSGRIMSHVPASANGGGSVTLAPGTRLTLAAGGSSFEAFIEGKAQSAIDSNNAMAGQIERAFG